MTVFQHVVAQYISVYTDSRGRLSLQKTMVCIANNYMSDNSTKASRHTAPSGRVVRMR